MNVTLFTTPTCPYCHTLKQFLIDHNIVFKEVDASKNESVREELIRLTGKLEVPVLEIDGQVIAGFDREKIVKLLYIK